MLKPVLSLLLCLALLAGCAAVPDDRHGGDGAVDRPRILERQPHPAEEEDVFYQLLVAEFAGSRGQLATALDAYMRAMYLTDDPQVAARATRITIYANQDVKGLEAARRWVELEPDSQAARQALGVFHLRNREPEEALRQFHRMVSLSDSRSQAFAQIGSVLGAEENRAGALQVISELAETHHDVAEAHVVHAQLALRDGNAGRAVQAAEAGLRNLPDSRELAMLRAHALIESGRGDEGAAAFQELADRHPDDTELRLYLARTLVQAGRSEEALNHFRRALADSPEDPALLYATGILTLETGRPTDAKQYFLRLDRQGQRAGEARFLLGQIAEDEGDIDEALQWYARVEGENVVPARFRRAILLGDMGRVDEARGEVREMRQRFPGEEVRSYLIEGEVLRRNREYDAARELYNEAIGRFPSNSDLVYGRALISVYQGDVTAAERDLRRILEEEPDNADALNALGYTLVDLTDRHEEGFDLVRRAYALAPDNPAILDSMGWAHYRLGNLDQALDYLQRAYERMPDAEIAAHLGEVLWKMDRREEARRIWREGMELDAEDDTLVETLERLDP